MGTMMNTNTDTDNFTLDDCEREDQRDGMGVRWTHPTGAWVELIHDDDPTHPLDSMEGVAISFRQGDGYQGTMDDHPADPVMTCQRCEGSGDDPERAFITRGRYGGERVGSGTIEAMEAEAERDDDLCIYAETCSLCKGEGEIETDIETYFRVVHGAHAIYEFSTGSHNEASAVMVITGDDFSDPISAAKAWAEEYESWAEGDVWGISTGGPGVEEESVWGFVGSDHAEAEALSTLRSTVPYVLREQAERAEWAARDTVTV